MTQTESVTTDSGVYTDIREVRTAQWVVNNDTELDTDTIIPRNKIGELKSNSFLWSKILEITDSMYASLPIIVGTITMEQLDSHKSVMRLIGLHGSEVVFGHNSYCVDVLPTLDTDGGKVTQILTSDDARRYSRTYDPALDKWTDFVPLDGQMTIEAKVIKGVLFVRHGYLPDNANIIILRKKRRNSNAGANRPQRSVKCAWYHSWKMVITKGTPNKWYVPFVKSTDKKFTAQVGQPVQSALQNLLYIWYDNNGVSRWRIAGVNKKWSTAKRGYAKLAIAVVQSDKHNITIDNMVGLKFRVANRVNGFIDKNLSVE